MAASPALPKNQCAQASPSTDPSGTDKSDCTATTSAAQVPLLLLEPLDAQWQLLAVGISEVPPLRDLRQDPSHCKFRNGEKDLA